MLRVRAIVVRSVRYWPVGAVAFVLAVATFFLAPKILKPIYISEAVVQHREVIRTQTLLGRPQQSESPRNTAMRLREMLLSRSNLEEIVRIHALYADTVASRGIVVAVDEFRNTLNVRVREGETFSIQFRGDDPAKVHAVTKALAESLVEQNRQYREEKAQATKAFLQVEAERTAAELNSRQQALAVFLAGHPEFAQEQGGEQMTAGASVRAAARAETSSSTQLSALQRQAQRLRQQIRSPAPSPVTASPPSSVDPETARAISAAQRELAAARRDLVDNQNRYTQQHPDVVAAESRVRSAQSALAAAQAEAQSSQPASAAPMPTDPEERRERLEAELARVESMIARAQRGEAVPESEASSGVVALETEWARLNRELDDVRQRNEQIQGRLFRASIIANVEASGKSSQMVIVDPAFLPKRPASRGPRRTGAVAAMVVMMLGSGLLLGLGFLNDRVYDEQDLRRLALGPVVHALPTSPGKKSRWRKSHG